MTLGERIVHYRKRQGLSQEQLSQRLGVSRQSVSKWERDESLPEADQAARCLPKHWACLWTRCCPGRRRPRPSPPGPRLPKAGCGEACLAVPALGLDGRLGAGRLRRRYLWAGLAGRFLMGPVFPPRELLLQAGGPVRAAALGFQIITVAVLVVGGLAVVGGLIAAAVLYRRRPGGKK